MARVFSGTDGPPSKSSNWKKLAQIGLKERAIKAEAKMGAFLTSICRLAILLAVFLLIQTSEATAEGEIEPKGLDLVQLVQLHTESVGGIFSLKAEIADMRDAAPDSGWEAGSEYNVMIKNEQVRVQALIRSLSNKPDKGPSVRTYHFTRYDNLKGSRSIEGLDPNDPPVFREDNDYKIFGYIEPAVNNTSQFRVNPYTPLLLKVPDFGGNSRSLKDLVARSKNARIVSTPGPNGDSGYIIALILRISIIGFP